MSVPPEDNKSAQSAFADHLDSKIARKLKAKAQRTVTVWLGLGMAGLIGWSVVVPTLVGTALGLWIDSHYPSRYAWTLMLLMLGLLVGCINAWQWVEKEQHKLHNPQDKPHE
jgi:ATP synthase protein I